MTVYPSFLDQFFADCQSPSIPQIHSPGKPADEQFPHQNNNGIGEGGNQIHAFLATNQPSNSNASLNSLFSSSSSSSYQFYDPSDNFSDLFPLLPDQEEDWLDFGSLLDGIDAQRTIRSATAGSSTTKAMWLEDGGERQKGRMEMDADKQPVAMRTRSHLPKSEQQIMRQRGAEEAIAFWQQEQIQQWIEAVDVEMKKKLGKTRTSSRTLAMRKNARKMMNGGGRHLRRRKISKDSAKNGSEFGKPGPNSKEPINVQQLMEIGNMGEANDVSMPALHYCICQRPDDQFSFYVGCDGCNGWFHAECVGTTQEQICAMDGPFFCPDCIKIGRGK